MHIRLQNKSIIGTHPSWSVQYSRYCIKVNTIFFFFFLLKSGTSPIHELISWVGEHLDSTFLTRSRQQWALPTIYSDVCQTLKILPAISLKAQYFDYTGVVVDNFSSRTIKYYPFIFFFSVYFLRMLQSFRYFSFQIVIVQSYINLYTIIKSNIFSYVFLTFILSLAEILTANSWLSYTAIWARSHSVPTV